MFLLEHSELMVAALCDRVTAFLNATWFMVISSVPRIAYLPDISLSKDACRNSVRDTCCRFTMFSSERVHVCRRNNILAT